MKKPKDDNASLGSILMDLEFVTRDQLNVVLEQQKVRRKRVNEETLLGRMLITEGYITEDQLQEAIVMQGRFRCKSKYQHSMAMADLAIKSKKRTQEKIEQTAKKITDEHPSLPDKTER